MRQRLPRDPDGDAGPVGQLWIEVKRQIRRAMAPSGVSVPAPQRPYLIVPILGQSNAYGMGKGLDLSGPDRPHPLVHQWAMAGRSRGTAVQAVDPLLHEMPGRGVIGFGMTFAKRLADETGRAVLLIPGARGDTSFTPKNGYTWDPADRRTRRNLYRNAVRAIDAALARYPGSTVAVVLWHQGETDVPLMAAPDYRVKLDSVIDGLRDRYGADLPVMLGQMVPEEMELSGKDYAPIDAVHADTPARRTRTAFVPGTPGFINGGVDRHYNAAGQRHLGADMWTAYRAMCGADIAAFSAD